LATALASAVMENASSKPGRTTGRRKARFSSSAVLVFRPGAPRPPSLPFRTRQRAGPWRPPRRGRAARPGPPRPPRTPHDTFSCRSALPTLRGVPGTPAARGSNSRGRARPQPPCACPPSRGRAPGTAVASRRPRRATAGSPSSGRTGRAAPAARRRTPTLRRARARPRPPSTWRLGRTAAGPAMPWPARSRRPRPASSTRAPSHYPRPATSSAGAPWPPGRPPRYSPLWRRPRAPPSRSRGASAARPARPPQFVEDVPP